MTQFASAPSRSTPFAEHSLVAYIAPLVEGRRVAVVGPSSAELARRARELGAQNVVAIGGSGDGVAVRPLGPGAIEAFRSRLDCVIVPDAESVPLGKVLDEARRTLGRDGVVVVATRADAQRRNDRALDFHGLRAALEDRFSTVKMVGAGSFAGYAIASFDQAAEDVTLDTRLMTDEPAAPELFIAVASDGRFAIDAMAIVQVPADAVTPPVAEGTDPATLDALDRLERTERALEIALQDQRAAMDRADALAADVERARGELTNARTELSNARGELSQGRDHSRKLSQRADELTRALADAERAERELRAAVEQAERDRDLARRDVQKARGESKDRERAVGEDIARLERALGEKGREGQALRAQLADRDSAVRELLYQLDALRGAEGSQRMAALESRNAELGALHAALGAEASRVAQQNDVLRERVARLESVIEAREAEAKQLEFQLTQARAQGAATAKVVHDERLIARHAEELARVRAEFDAKLTAARAENDAAARRARAESDAEHALQQVEQAARAARARDEADEEAAKLRAELEHNKRRALDAELALKNTLQRFTAVEAAESDARARAASAETRLADALRAASQQSGNTALLAPLHEELSASNARVAALESSLEAERERQSLASRAVEELRAQLTAAQESAAQHEASARRAAERATAGEAAQQQLDAVRAQLASALDAEDDLQDQLGNTRSELSRLLALNASIDERVSQLELELEGSRKGYTRRVRELEREVEQLVRALEVATSSAGEDADAVSAVQRELDQMRAERAGIAFRLADTETALDTLSKAAAAAAATTSEPAPSEPPPALPKSDPPAAPDNRAEQLLATLAETAARLASTEETLNELTAQLEAARQKADTLELELDAAKVRAAEASDARAKSVAPPSAPSADVDALKRESSEKELLVRSLVAQLEDRDLRLRALERRLVEEVERARRTESEIWELELRARDQRIAAMQREIERAPSESSRAPTVAPDAAAVRAELATKASEAESALRSIDRVRATLSAILVDGRGAGVSHELVALLRELDEPSAES